VEYKAMQLRKEMKNILNVLFKIRSDEFRASKIYHRRRGLISRGILLGKVQ
jgi:hypothetical protein